MSNNTKVVITGDTSGAVSAVTRLKAELGGLQSLAAKALSFSGVGLTLGIGGAVAAMVSMTKHTIETGDALAKMSQKTGVSVEDLSKLQYAAELSGVSTEALQKGMSSLAVGMVEARDGGITPAAEAFAKFGVSVKNTDGTVKSSRVVLGELADRFAAMPDGPEKAALAVDLFGKKLGAEMIPLLNGGSQGLQDMGDEAERLGIVMSAELAKKSEEFNDNLARMGKLSEAAGISIAQTLIPAVNDYLTHIVDASKAGVGLTTDVFFGAGLKDVAKTIDQISTKIDALKKKQADGGTLFFGDIGQDIKDLEKLRKYYELQQARQTGDGVQSAEELAAKRLSIEKQLQAKLAQLATLRGIAEGRVSADILDGDDKRTAAQIKNAESLQKALSAAWQRSVKEAAAAGDEAEKLFSRADDVRQSGATRAAEKLRSALSPEEQQKQIVDEFSTAANAADQSAWLAMVARLNGQIENSAKLTKDAERDAQRAADLAARFDDPKAGADAIKKAADIQAKVIEEQARAKQQEQKDLTSRAEEQQAELAKLDQALAELQIKAGALKVEADISAAAGQIAALQAQLDNLQDKTITVTVNRVGDGAADGAVSPGASGFARGGYTGPGGKWQPAGIVHAGEFVLRQEVVRQRGAIDFLARFNNIGLSALKGYDGGGLVDNIRIPSIDVPQPQTKAGGTPITLVLDGHRVPVTASQDVAKELTLLFSREALKRGGRR